MSSGTPYSVGPFKVPSNMGRLKKPIVLAELVLATEMQIRIASCLGK
jgi:hypothetical protein